MLSLLRPEGLLRILPLKTSVLAYFAAPTALVLVCLYHIYTVETTALTRWRGGGFGMYADISYNVSRHIRGYMRHGDKRALFMVRNVEIPGHGNPCQNILIYPRKSNLQGMYESIAAIDWKHLESTPWWLDFGPTQYYDMETLRNHSSISLEVYEVRFDPRSGVARAEILETYSPVAAAQ